MTSNHIRTTTMEQHHFPMNLKTLRMRRELSQQDMANALGVKRSTYSAWENGVAEPRLKHLNQIQHYHQVGVDVLLGASLYAYRQEELDRLAVGMAPRPRVVRTEMASR